MIDATVTRFNPDVGYGFARLEDGTEIFIRRQEIVVPKTRILKGGDKLTLDIYRTDKGAAAINIKLAE